MYYGQGLFNSGFYEASLYYPPCIMIRTGGIHLRYCASLFLQLHERQADRASSFARIVNTAYEIRGRLGKGVGGGVHMVQGRF